MKNVSMTQNGIVLILVMMVLVFGMQAISSSVGTAATHPGIYWGFSDKIQRADLDGTNVHDVVTGLDPLKRLILSGIAVDITGGKIYWTQSEFSAETHTGQIQSANLDGTNVRTLVTGLLRPRGIALDVASGKIYWATGKMSGADVSVGSKIQSANLDGSNVRDILTGLGPVRNMALDVVGRKIYWIDWYKIQSANFDGSNLAELASGFANMFGIALDVVGRKMYWTNGNSNRGGGFVYRADFDGSNLTELVQIRDTLPENIALDVAGGKMYWESRNWVPARGVWDPREILCADLDGAKVINLVPKDAGSVANMTLGIPPQTVAAPPTQTTPDRTPLRSAGPDAIENMVVNQTSEDIYVIYSIDRRWGESTSVLFETHGSYFETSGYYKIAPGEQRSFEQPTFNVDSERQISFRISKRGEAIKPQSPTRTFLSWIHPTKGFRIDSLGLGDMNPESVAYSSQPRDELILADGFMSYYGSYQIYVTSAWVKVNNRIQTPVATTPVVPTPQPTVVPTPQPNVGTPSTHPDIYWPDWDRGTIHHFNGLNVNTLVFGAGYPSSIAVDIAGGKVYWTNSGVRYVREAVIPNGKIQCANLDGSNVRTLVTGLHFPSHIALDVVGGKIYWTTSPSPQVPQGNKIQWADLDGSNVQDLVTDEVGYPGTIALDAANGKMYWTDSDKIRSADLDGSNITQLVATNLTGVGMSNVSGLALDVVGGKMYWTDIGKNRNGMIRRADLDGSNITTLVFTGENFPRGLALDIAGGKMYWGSTRRGSNKIWCANLDGSNVRDIATVVGVPWDIDLGILPQTAGVRPRQTTPDRVAPGTPPTPTPQPTSIRIPDRNLRAAIQQEIGNTITTQTLLNLTSLDAYDLGITNLTGLEHATNLSVLHLWGNSISDISPLAGLTQLTELDLFDNNISDISPLVGLTRLTDLYLKDNPLNDAALTTYIPAIQANGTEVGFDNRTPTTSPPPSVVGTPVTIPPNVRTTGSHPPMYWVDLSANKIQHFNGSNVRNIVTGLDGPSDIALDVAGGKMYWIDWDKIQCANLDGSNVQDIVTGLDRISGLALDAAGGKIYWTNTPWNASVLHSKWGDPGKIQCANLNGSNVQDIITGLDRISGLALDVAGGKIYWTNSKWNDTKGKWDPGEIQWADLDGSNVQDLFTGLNGPSDIALDVTGGKMYWTFWEDGYTKIQRADLDGSNVQDIVTEIEDPVDSLALDVAGGKMYWTSLWSGKSKIQWADLDSPNVQDLFTGLDYPTDIALGIPPQTTGTSPKKTTQILVDATDRPSMYWIDNDTLYRLTGANAQPIAEHVNDVVVDTTGERLYWTAQSTKNTGTINTANLDGTNPEILRTLRSVPRGIALDSTNGKLYLANSQHRLQRINSDGTGFEYDFILNVDAPMDIAISANSVYWTDANGNVRFANTEGAKVVRNIATGSGTLGGIAVGGNKVYWTAQTGNSSGEIRSANLNGKGVTVVATLTAIPQGITVDTREGYIYWTDDQGSVRRMRLDGTKRQNLVDNLVAPGAIAIGGETTVAPMMATTPATTYRAEDVNQDGRVDDVDLGMVAAALFGENPPATPGRLDVNGDGVLNIVDLTLVRTNIDEDDAMVGDDAMAMAAPALGIQRNALAREKIQAAIDLLLATDDGSLGVRRTLAYLQNLLAAVRPDETQLLANYPNPFNPETWIPYQLSTGSDVRITIYDMSGTVVRKLVLGYQSSGYYTSRSRAAYWDGRNAIGEPVASGLYFYTFTAGDFTATRKLLIRK